MLNQQFIKEKIELIEQELAHLQALSKHSMQEIVSNFTLQAAFERFLERIVVRATDINEHIIEELADTTMKAPQSYKETFFSLSRLAIFPDEFAKKMVKGVNTRNALVHDYDDFNLADIYSSAKDCLSDFHQYCEYILKFLEKN